VKYKSRPTPGTVADLVLRFRMAPRYRRWAAERLGLVETNVVRLRRTE